VSGSHFPFLQHTIPNTAPNSFLVTKLKSVITCNPGPRPLSRKAVSETSVAVANACQRRSLSCPCNSRALPFIIDAQLRQKDRVSSPRPAESQHLHLSPDAVFVPVRRQVSCGWHNIQRSTYPTNNTSPSPNKTTTRPRSNASKRCDVKSPRDAFFLGSCVTMWRCGSRRRDRVIPRIDATLTICCRCIFYDDVSWVSSFTWFAYLTYKDLKRISTQL
jgi:hypothetical protein